MDVVGTIETGGETMDMTNKLYCETVDEKLQVYTQFGGNWYNAGDGSTTSMAQQFDIAKVMELYVSAMQDFAAARYRETINGVETTRYEGVLSEEYFQQVLDDPACFRKSAKQRMTKMPRKKTFYGYRQRADHDLGRYGGRVVMPVQYALI